MSERTIDFSRYRVAEAIAESWAADGVVAAAGWFEPGNFSHLSQPERQWLVELIVAAHDRKGKYEPKVPA